MKSRLHLKAAFKAAFSFFLFDHIWGNSAKMASEKNLLALLYCKIREHSPFEWSKETAVKSSVC